MSHKCYIFILLFLGYNSLFCQERSESQKYTYETKTLNIEMESNLYYLNERSNLNITFKFINNSIDTSFVYPLDRTENFQINEPGFAVFFSNFSESYEDYYDTLLILKPKSTLKFELNLPITYFFQFKNDFGIIRSVIDIGYFSSIERIKESTYSKGKLFFQNSRLVLPHSIIELLAQRIRVRMLNFEFE